jgi:hypothetical protein
MTQPRSIRPIANGPSPLHASRRRPVNIYGLVYLARNVTRHHASGGLRVFVCGIRSSTGGSPPSIKRADITCSLLAMMHDCAVCGTVIPVLRQFHGWEFNHGRSVYGVAFQLFERCVAATLLAPYPSRVGPIFDQ